MRGLGFHTIFIYCVLSFVFFNFVCRIFPFVFCVLTFVYCILAFAFRILIIWGYHTDISKMWKIRKNVRYNNINNTFHERQIVKNNK